MVTSQRFAQAVREKYPDRPEVQEADDTSLINAYLEKYPVYADQIEYPPEASIGVPRSILEPKPQPEPLVPKMTTTQGGEAQIGPLTPEQQKDFLVSGYEKQLGMYKPPAPSAMQNVEGFAGGALSGLVPGAAEMNPDLVAAEKAAPTAAMAGKLVGMIPAFGLGYKAWELPEGASWLAKLVRGTGIMGAYRAAEVAPENRPIWEKGLDVGISGLAGGLLDIPFGPTIKPKLPWQKRGGEYAREAVKYDEILVPKESQYYDDFIAQKVGDAITDHKAEVLGALDRGEKVPAQVLADYGLDRVGNFKPELAINLNTPKYAGSINLEKYPVEVRGKILEAAEKAGLMTRPVVGETEIRKMAADMAARGEEPSILNKIVKAARGKLAAEMKMAQNKLADMIINSNGELSDMVIQAETLSRGGEEAGRTLGSLAWPVNKARMMIRLIDEYMKKATPNEIAQWLEIKKSIIGQYDPAMIDKLVEWATAIKLTNPFTHMRNVIGNTYSSLMRPIEKTIAGGVNLFESTVSKKPQERFMREALADAVGRVLGMGRGAAKGLRAFVGFDELANIDWVRNLKGTGDFLQEQAAKSIMDAGKAAEVGQPSIGGLRGYLVRTPFRALSAMDEFFRSLAHNGEAYGLAEREALKRGFKGADKWAFVEKRANQIMKQVEASVRAGRAPGAIAKGMPSEVVYSSPELKPWEQVRLLASESLYQSELDGFFGYLNSARNQYPMIKLIIPFFKTPINLAKYQLQRSPVGFLSPRNWADLVKSSGTRSEAMARLTVGVGMTAAATVAAMNGWITGSGPKEATKRDLLYATGWQPYSFRLNFDGKDHWVSMRGFEPITGYFSTLADAVEKYQEQGAPENLEETYADIWHATYIASMNIINQPFMMGLRSFLDATIDENKARMFFDQTVGGMVTPTIARYATKIMSPGLKRQDNTISKIVGGLPWANDSLPPRLNILGEEIKLDDNPVFRALGITTIRDYRVAEELARLNVVPTMPGKVFPIKDRKVKLKQEEIDSFLKIRGQAIKTVLSKVVESDGYLMADDQTKELILKTALRKIGEPYARYKKKAAADPNRLEEPELILSPYVKEAPGQEEPYTE